MLGNMGDTQVKPRIAVGDGGWLFVVVGRVEAFVRVDADEDGRLSVGAVLLQTHVIRKARRVPLRGVDVRTFPLAAVEAAANGELRDAIMAGMDGDVTMKLSGKGKLPGQPPRRTSDPKVDLVIERPTSKPYPDAFYAQVARRYIDAVARFGSNRPAALIAEANGVPLNTVHRWVGEARKRKFLAPGRPGKAG